MTDKEKELEALKRDEDAREESERREAAISEALSWVSAAIHDLEHGC